MSNIPPGPPSRFPNGISTNQNVENLGEFALPDPTQFHSYFQDFDTYVAANWTVTEVGVATQALADEDGGVLLVTNAAADNDSSANQKVGESHLFESGKKLFFKARFKVSETLQSQLIMGLQITDTTPFDVSDGVYFSKDDADETLQLKVEKDGTVTTTDVLEMVDDTYVEVGFFYNGNDQIRIYSGNDFVDSSVTTNLPDDEELTVSFFIENGEAVAKTMSVDYIFVAKER